MRTRTTLVRISSTKRTRNLAWLVGVTILGLSPVVVFGLIRLAVCATDNRGQTVMECLSGRTAVVHATLEAPKPGREGP